MAMCWTTSIFNDNFPNSNMLRCVEVLSRCYGHLLYTHLITITKPWAQDAIYCFVYEWVFNLHGCVMQHLMAVSGVVTDWSSCFISVLLCPLVYAHTSNTIIMISVACAKCQSDQRNPILFVKR